MKRILTLILALCLMIPLSVPALAETDMEAALTAVTSHVKDVLDVEDDWQNFSGEKTDGLRPGWYLRWFQDGRELTVNCTEDGLVTEVWFWREGDRSLFTGFDAAFPALTEAEARAQAEARLARLMGENETARIDGHSAELTRNGRHSFTGTILLNGLPGPVSFTITLDGEGLRAYTRSDSGRAYIGGVPSAVSAVTASQAAKTLAPLSAFELYYVEEDGQARLRYVPVWPYTLVDAATGEAVDMDALYASFGGARYSPEAPAEEAAMAMDGGGNGRGLTEVELSSIANYRDVLAKEALDAAVRALPGLMLEDFTLDRCAYRMDADGNITASLRYACEMSPERLFGFSLSAYEEQLSWGGTPTVYRYAELDAKTGELRSLFTNYPLWDGARETEAVTDMSSAETFLEAAAPELYAQARLCTLRAVSGQRGQVWARVHDGYFFPANYLSVHVDPGTGAIDEYSRVWDEDMRFAPSKGLVSETAARQAYLGALELTLGYAAWPEAIDPGDPVLYRYADWGYSYVESLRLGWWYDGRGRVAGVDALTGSVIADEAGGGYAYTDLGGVPERAAIEALGAAGVGFAGGFFRPAEVLTQRDAVTLLLQAAGYDVSRWTDETLRSQAVWLGFVPAEDWAPDRVLTGAAFAHMLIGASAYGPAAELPGVGYGIIAPALGLTAGEGPITRAGAAMQLYTFMCR